MYWKWKNGAAKWVKCKWFPRACVYPHHLHPWDSRGKFQCCVWTYLRLIKLIELHFQFYKSAAVFPHPCTSSHHWAACPLPIHSYQLGQSSTLQDRRKAMQKSHQAPNSCLSFGPFYLPPFLSSLTSHCLCPHCSCFSHSLDPLPPTITSLLASSFFHHLASHLSLIWSTTFIQLSLASLPTLIPEFYLGGRVW